MAAIKQLAAVARSGTGKGAARSVRREGRVPAVIYGGGVKPEPISVDYKDVNKFIFAGHFLTSIFELEVDGRKERVLPRDYQLDVVTDRPVHVDFLRLSPGSRVRIGIPVHVANREASPGLKKGGAVNLVLHTVEVMAPADDIPESITIDLAGMDFHDSVHVSALKLPEGCRPLSGTAEMTVVTIVPPTVMVEETPAAGAASRARSRRGRRRCACGRRSSEGRRRQGRRRAGESRGRARRGQAGRQEVTRSADEVGRSAGAGASAPDGSGSRRGEAAPPRRSIGDPMLVIAGLGNPGARHARNRHNIGFMAVDAIAEARRFGPFRARYQGLAAEGLIGDTRVMLLKPETYMNESGRSVGAALRYAKLDLSALVVIHDELDLAPGQGEGQGRRRRRRPQRTALDHRPPRPRL